MPKTLKEFMDERGQLAKQIKALAERQSEWTAEDRSEWETINPKYDAIQDQIESLEEANAVEARTAVVMSPPSDFSAHSAVARNTRANDVDHSQGPQLVNLRTGEQVPTVTFERGLEMSPADKRCDLGRFFLSGALGPDVLNEHERALTTATPGVPEAFLSSWIDNLRTRLVCLQAGALMFNVDAGVTHMASVTADPTAEFLAELASSTPSDATVADIVLNPYRLQTTSIVSNECLADSLNASQIMAQTALGAQSVAIDGACLSGTGSGANMPQGIIGTAGINTLAVTGDLTWESISEAVALLQEDHFNDELSRLALVCHPTDAHQLRIQKASTAGPWLSVPGDWTQQPRVLVTTGVSQGTAILGDFRNLAIAQRLQSVTWHDAGTVASTDLVTQYATAMRLVTRTDCAVLRPSQFCTLTGLTGPAVLAAATKKKAGAK